MGGKRPLGSRDWNHNGEYDFFDKVTDRYVYDKVTHYEPEPKIPKPKKVAPPPETPKEDDPFESIKIVATFFMIAVVIGVTLHLLGDFMFH